MILAEPVSAVVVVFPAANALPKIALPEPLRPSVPRKVKLAFFRCPDAPTRISPFVPVVASYVLPVSFLITKSIFRPGFELEESSTKPEAEHAVASRIQTRFKST